VEADRDGAGAGQGGEQVAGAGARHQLEPRADAEGGVPGDEVGDEAGVRGGEPVDPVLEVEVGSVGVARGEHVAGGHGRELEAGDPVHPGTAPPVGRPLEAEGEVLGEQHLPDATFPTVRTALAIDIGGTKVAVGIVTEAGELLRSATAPTPGDDLFARLGSLIDEVRAAGDEAPDVCGVGCGGPMTAGGEAVSPLNIPQWRGFELRSRLAEATGLPTFVDNDAKALALGEGWVGAAAGVDDFIAMVVSTGVGGGIVLNGRLLDGASGNAGHIGHVIVVPGGRACVCGARGCLEAEASGTALFERTGRPAAAADHLLRTETGTLVGRAVASVANLLDLRLAVVGGSVALGFGEPFFASAQAELDRSARLDFSAGARIIPGGLGPNGPLIGAARVGLVATRR
jgi:glucokinase